MVGIYCITNLINGKRYIGQSKNIEERWKKHKRNAFNFKDTNYNKYFYQAIRKYGLDNFKFEVIEECKIEELDEREIYWISFYQTFPPDLGKGYNLTKGGEAFFRLDKSYFHLEEIINLLRNSNFTQQEIANKFGIAQTMVSGINSGKYFHNESLDYPIRGSNHGCKRISRGYSLRPKSRENTTCPICGGYKNKYARYCNECRKKLKEDLNSKGKPRVIFPRIERPSLEDLLSKLFETQNNQATADYFGISTMLLKKWMDDLGIPRKRIDYNNMYRVKVLNEEPLTLKEKSHIEVLKIDPKTNKTIEKFNSIGKAVESVGVNRKSTTAFYSYVNTDKIYKGYLWKM